MLISQPGQALKEDRTEESRRRRWEKDPLFPENLRRFHSRGTVCVCAYNLPRLLPLSLAAFLLHNSVTLPAATVLSESAPSISLACLPACLPLLLWTLVVCLLSSSLLCVCVCVCVCLSLVSSAFSCCLLSCLLAVDFCNNKFLFWRRRRKLLQL